MTRNQKIGIGCAVALALVAAVVLVGALFIRSAFEDLRSEGQQTMADAESFGRGQPASACLDEAFSRQAACDGLVCEATVNAWAQGCLRASDRPPGFCDGVPAESEIRASVDWRIARCRARGAADVQACGRLIAGIQAVCAGR